MPATEFLLQCFLLLHWRKHWQDSVQWTKSNIREPIFILQFSRNSTTSFISGRNCLWNRYLFSHWSKFPWQYFSLYPPFCLEKQLNPILNALNYSAEWQNKFVFIICLNWGNWRDYHKSKSSFSRFETWNSNFVYQTNNISPLTCPFKFTFFYAPCNMGIFHQLH